MTEKKTHTIDLLGARLAVKTTQTPAEFEQVVATLSARIAEIQRGAASVDTLKLALLAGLDIARELVDARRERDELRDATTERTLALVERLEAETAQGEFDDQALMGDKRDKSVLV